MSDASLSLQFERSLGDERIAICDRPRVIRLKIKWWSAEERREDPFVVTIDTVVSDH